MKVAWVKFRGEPAAGHSGRGTPFDRPRAPRNTILAPMWYVTRTSTWYDWCAGQTRTFFLVATRATAWLTKGVLMAQACILMNYMTTIRLK